MPQTNKCQPRILLQIIKLLSLIFVLVAFFWMFNSNDSSQFRVDDLNNSKDFVISLKNAADPVSLYIYKQISKDTLELLNEYNYKSDDLPSNELLDALVDELNKLLDDQSFYDSERFDGITLSDKVTKEKSQMSLVGNGLKRFNRSLLVSVYPQEIKKNHLTREEEASCILFAFALFFTSIFTCIQYFGFKNLEGSNPFAGFLIVILCLIIGGAILAVLLEFTGYGHHLPEFLNPSTFFKKSWQTKLFPTSKNVIVSLIAGIFLIVDGHIICQKSSWKVLFSHQLVYEDFAVLVSLLFVGFFVGELVHNYKLSADYASAFNSGVLCFHLFLGTMLFKGISLEKQKLERE